MNEAVKVPVAVEILCINLQRFVTAKQGKQVGTPVTVQVFSFKLLTSTNHLDLQIRVVFHHEAFQRVRLDPSARHAHLEKPLL